jgi:hypothetical protein
LVQEEKTKTPGITEGKDLRAGLKPALLLILLSLLN